MTIALIGGTGPIGAKTDDRGGVLFAVRCEPARVRDGYEN